MEADPRRVSAIPTVSRYSFPGQFTMNLSRGKFLGRMAQAETDSCDFDGGRARNALRFGTIAILGRILAFSRLSCMTSFIQNEPDGKRIGCLVETCFWPIFIVILPLQNGDFPINMASYSGFSHKKCIMTGLKLHYDIL